MFYIGTAGWSLPQQVKEDFPNEGTHLERYAKVFNAVEINSAFYKNHKPETYIKWANSTPSDFRFSVKLSKYFIHEQRFTETGDDLAEVIAGIKGLGSKLGGLLVQLPPSLEFNAPTVEKFIAAVRDNFDGALLWEPRHLSWTSDAAIDLLASFNVSKVLADPEPCRPTKAQRKKIETTRYLRLHGSPEIYKSRYSEETIEKVANLMKSPPSPASNTWCIFDNTTYGFATENALELKTFLNQGVAYGNERTASRPIN